jgi:hypothetical protein
MEGLFGSLDAALQGIDLVSPPHAAHEAVATQFSLSSVALNATDDSGKDAAVVAVTEGDAKEKEEAHDAGDGAQGALPSPRGVSEPALEETGAKEPREGSHAKLVAALLSDAIGSEAARTRAASTVVSAYVREHVFLLLSFLPRSPFRRRV